MPKTPQFSNDKIGKKITGNYGIYEYEMYYLPIRDGPLFEELITKILARKQKDTTKPCLDTTRDEIESYNTENTIHAFGFIRDPLYPKDEASGSIQINYDGHIYLSDLCRNFNAVRNTNVSPIKVLLGFFENIIKTELGRSKVRLMVLFKKDDVEQHDNDILQDIYSKYGFVKTKKPYTDGTQYEYIVMEKNLATPKTKSKTPRTSSILSKNKPAKKSVNKSRKNGALSKAPSKV